MRKQLIPGLPSPRRGWPGVEANCSVEANIIPSALCTPCYVHLLNCPVQNRLNHYCFFVLYCMYIQCTCINLPLGVMLIYCIQTSGVVNNYYIIYMYVYPYIYSAPTRMEAFAIMAVASQISSPPPSPPPPYNVSICYKMKK